MQRVYVHPVLRLQRQLDICNWKEESESVAFLGSVVIADEDSKRKTQTRRTQTQKKQKIGRNGHRK